MVIITTKGKASFSLDIRLRVSGSYNCILKVLLNKENTLGFLALVFHTLKWKTTENRICAGILNCDKLCNMYQNGKHSHILGDEEA